MTGATIQQNTSRQAAVLCRAWVVCVVFVVSVAGSKAEVFAASVASLVAFPPKPSTVLATPQASARLILWDGDTESRASGGWSGPNSSLNTLEATQSEAHGGTTSLHWHGEGSGLVGAAWNFFNREQAVDGLTGFDISGHSILRLWLKVSAEAGREPSGLSIRLISASNRRSSAEITLDEIVKKSSDGQWHEVVIPLPDLLPAASPEIPAATGFDPQTVWEIGLSSWSQDERAFDVYIDDISVDAAIKTPASKPKLKPKPKSKLKAKKPVPKKHVARKRARKTKSSHR